MHTLMMTGIGLALLALFTWGARRLNADTERAINGPLMFIPVWLAVSAVNFLVGVLSAGYSVRDELLVHAVVFGLPAIIAWFLLRRERGSARASQSS